MNKILLTVVITLVFSSTLSAVPVFFSFGGEKIVKIQDFPDNDNFKSSEGYYIDAGYIFKQVTIFFIPIWNYKGRWTGYVGNDSKFLELTKEELDNIASIANLKLPDSPSLPFWDYMGGKILAIFLVFMYFIMTSKNDSDENNSDENNSDEIKEA